MSVPSQSRPSPNRCSQPTQGEQASPDIEMRYRPSPARDLSQGNKPPPSKPSELSSSSPLSIRITGSQGRPLFPTFDLPLRPAPNSESANAAQQDTPGPSSSDDSLKEKQTYQFNSMVEMIKAHVEELKKRPLRGAPKSEVERRSGGGGEA
ncbi:hypothetical protein GGR54DRAFT_243682 [Hypoxylon sp. NC1633]|nr:hypothetical protein GGR54DRAFT_243682 [Hypoxylon sp. NC1633]